MLTFLALKNAMVLEKMSENIHFESSTIPVYIRKEYIKKFDRIL